MSETSEQDGLVASAESVDAQATAWFRRRNFWAWNEADQSALDMWLAQSPSHEIAYWRIMGAWSRTERLSALQRPMKVSETPRRTFLTFAKYAVASLIVASIAGLAGWSYFSDPAEQSFRTPIGGRKILTFADGTRIELNTDTVLRAHIDRKQRVAELVRGEAYFAVQHDARRPFVVTAAGHRIIDLGTEFAIRTGDGNIRVSVFKGRAELERADARNSDHTTVLVPGDVATASAETVSVTNKSVADISTNAAWRRGLLIFKYTPLRDAVAEINRYNTDKLVIADGSVANRTVYGTVPTQSIQAFVRVATSALGLRVEKLGNEYVISR